MKTLILLVLLFDGTLLKEKVILPINTDVYGCLDYGAKYVESITNEKGIYLNDKRGTIQGYYCE
jgi:hypothetical protein|tara:strand:+ start:672 stop:863 length:192 start_codon:yes stop_codon:yes gene_type:complete